MIWKSFYSDRLQLAASVWLIVTSLVFVSYALLNPKAHWDMLAYAATAEQLNKTDPQVIHEKVYNELEARVSAEEFETITSSNHYRTVMYDDVQAFNEQLPYYSIRIAFNALLATFSDLGVSAYDTGFVISALAFVVSLLVIWGSLVNRIHPVVQIILPLLFYNYTDSLQVIRIILADSLATLWAASICIAYLRKSRMLFVLIALSALFRIDLAIFAGLVLLLMLFTEDRKNVRLLALCGVFLVGSFLLVQYWAGSYGWKTLYYFAIISDMNATHPSEYRELGFTIEEYFRSLYDPSRWFSKMYLVTALCGIITLFVWRTSETDSFNRRVCRISFVCILYIAVHYFIFPQMYLRFFVSQNLMIVAGFGVLCTSYWCAYVKDKTPAVEVTRLTELKGSGGLTNSYRR